MAYDPTYQESDISPIVMDGMVKVIVGVASFAALIAIVLAVAFFKALTKR